MDGKKLKNLLRGVKIINPDKVDDYFVWDTSVKPGCILIEDILDRGESTSTGKVIDREQFLIELNDDTDYYIRGFDYFEGNMEYNIGVQMIENLENGRVLALVAFADSSDSVDENSPSIPLVFKNTTYYHRWLRQSKIVYAINLGSGLEVVVYGRIRNHQIDIIVKRYGLETSFITTSFDVKGSRETLMSFVESQIKELEIVDY